MKNQVLLVTIVLLMFSISARTSSPPYEGGVAAAAADGVVLSTLVSGVPTKLWNFSRDFAQTSNNALPHSMKGYELYSWQSRGQWYFSLVVGTNRQKTYQEIVSPRVRIKGAARLKRKLDLLPDGEELTWSRHRISKMTMPPRSIVDEIIDHCRKRRLNLRMSSH